MRKLIPLLILIALTLPLCGQINGELQYIGPKAILQVWGTHFQRGIAGSGLRPLSKIPHCCLP